MPDKEEIELIEKGDQSISDMIAQPPGFLLHSGITIIVIIISSLLLISYFIKYPDKISANGVITTEVPPLSILTATDGELERIFFETNDTIESGKYIAYIKNAASLEAVDKLDLVVEKLNNRKKSDNYLIFELPTIEDLGMLQDSYSSLKQKYEILQLTLKKSGVDHQLKSIVKRIDKIKMLNSSLAREKELFYSELQIKEKDVERQKALKESGTVSALSIEKIESEYLQYQRQYEGMESGIIQNEINIEMLEQESIQLLEGRNDDLTSQIIGINKNISELQYAKKVWEEQYFVKSEQSGILIYENDIHLDMFVESGTLIAHVVPHNNSNKIIKTMIPVMASGKIKVNQEINLKLPAYPYKEFGTLKSKVQEISSLPTTTDVGVFYELIGQLPDSLITNYKIKIDYQPNMPVIAEIITEDRTILERIFGQILDIIKNK